MALMLAAGVGDVASQPTGGARLHVPAGELLTTRLIPDRSTPADFGPHLVREV